MAKKRVRIKDIAIAAGVSTGTVDRVIHNRGNVLPAVKKRIEEVMKVLDYQPNIMASTLANNRVLKIATLLPDYRKDSYWESPFKGIEKAIREKDKAYVQIPASMAYGKKGLQNLVGPNTPILYDIMLMKNK